MDYRKKMIIKSLFQNEKKIKCYFGEKSRYGDVIFEMKFDLELKDDLIEATGLDHVRNHETSVGATIGKDNSSHVSMEYDKEASALKINMCYIDRSRKYPTMINEKGPRTPHYMNIEDRYTCTETVKCDPEDSLYIFAIMSPILPRVKVYSPEEFAPDFTSKEGVADIVETLLYNDELVLMDSIDSTFSILYSETAAHKTVSDFSTYKAAFNMIPYIEESEDITAYDQHNDAHDFPDLGINATYDHSNNKIVVRTKNSHHIADIKLNKNKVPINITTEIGDDVNTIVDDTLIIFTKDGERDNLQIRHKDNRYIIDLSRQYSKYSTKNMFLVIQVNDVAYKYVIDENGECYVFTNSVECNGRTEFISCYTRNLFDKSKSDFSSYIYESIEDYPDFHVLGVPMSISF